ncbi:MAG: toll/interleukin-1 receptor domain-containing protein [Nitrosomonas sp. PRO4]|nr:toll/interleukin-1 receptor domain-containing protein [Nitrosomonas sp. PRO4]
MEAQQKKDFFISYNQADVEMAGWIDEQLKSAGYTTKIQKVDFGPGNNFVWEMQKAATEATRTIAVLSPDYFQSKFTVPEWAAAFVQDPLGEQRLLIPVRVRPVELTGFFETIVYIDLVDREEEEAKAHLLSGIKGLVSIPKPAFKKATTTSVLSHKPISGSEYQLGQINRLMQRDHFAAQISLQKGRKTHGFLISGELQECPEDIRFKLSYLLQKDLSHYFPQTPEITRLHIEKSGLAGKSAEQYLWELLGEFLSCQAEKTAIEMRLSQLDSSHIFFRELPSYEAVNQAFLVKLVAAWTGLSLPVHSPNHFLLLIHATESNKKPLFGWSPFAKQTPSWRNQMKELLEQHQFIESMLPELHSPTKQEIRDWAKLHIEESALRESINDLLTTKFLKNESIPLGEFKKAMLPILKNHFSQ